MLYAFFRFLFSLALPVYFRRVKIHYASPLPREAPLILAANHNSAVMDPIVLACLHKKQVHFMARGETINSPFRKWFLGRLHLLPVYRKEVSPEKLHKNKDLYKVCSTLLENKKTLIFFPEASSETVPRLRPLKTGLARMALAAEAANGFNLHTRVVPVSINYSDSHRFRSEVLVVFGKPIETDAFRAQYLENRAEAVNALTQKIAEGIEENLLIIPREEQEKMVRRAIHTSEVSQTSGYMALQNSRELAHALHVYSKEYPSVAKALAEALDSYVDTIGQYKIGNRALETYDKTRFLPGVLKTLMIALTGLPVFLYGLINNAPALLLSRYFAKRFTKRADFYGSILLIGGLFTFMFFYIIQCLLVALVTGSALLAAVYLLSIILSLHFLLRYKNWLHKRLKMIRFQKFSKRFPEKADELQAQRQRLLALLEDITSRYRTG